MTCSVIDCPRPTAVSDLLRDRETEHIVALGPSSFTVRHPLRERLDDDLLTCDLPHHIADSDGPPGEPGRYRVVSAGGRWVWDRLDSKSAT